MTSNVENM
jgi:serine/threonine protein kinase